VNTAGAISEALALAGLAVPEVQVRETVTLAPLLGTKSFFTENSALRRVLVMVHSLFWPSARLTLPDGSQSPPMTLV
jgi:hypothetical protein